MVFSSVSFGLSAVCGTCLPNRCAVATHSSATGRNLRKGTHTYVMVRRLLHSESRSGGVNHAYPNCWNRHREGRVSPRRPRRKGHSSGEEEVLPASIIGVYGESGASRMGRPDDGTR